MDGSCPPPEWHLAHFAKVQRLIENHYGPILECVHAYPIRIEPQRVALNQREEWASWLKIDHHVWQSTWGESSHTRVRIYNVCHCIDLTIDVWPDDEGAAVLRDNLAECLRRNRALMLAA